MLDKEFNAIREENSRLIRELGVDFNSETRSASTNDNSKYRVIPNPDDVNKYRVQAKNSNDPVWLNQFKS